MEVVAVFSIMLHLINGMMLGIEFPPKETIDAEHPETVGFVICIDLLVLRLVIFTDREPPKK